MTLAEQKGLYLGTYHKLLDELRIVKYEKPALYDDMAEVVTRYRKWVADVGQIDDLPPVPGKP